MHVDGKICFPGPGHHKNTFPGGFKGLDMAKYFIETTKLPQLGCFRGL